MIDTQTHALNRGLPQPFRPQLPRIRDRVRIVRLFATTATLLVLGLAASAQDMTLIPAGTFSMGDAFSEGGVEERPVHEVTLAAFFMDTKAVTKAFWDEVANWAKDRTYDITAGGGTGKAANHPVYDISWYEALKWSNARSEKEKLTPCYTVSGQVYRAGESIPDCNWNADGYRLPTEAEWEKAARGGAAGRRFPWADTDTIQHARANYYSSATYGYDTSPTRGYHPDYTPGQTTPYTSPVDSFTPNGYGMYNMSGNLYAWCWDYYDPGYYLTSPPVDPRGPSTGTERLMRGGSWGSQSSSCRVAFRASKPPDFSSFGLGLRLVRRPPGEESCVVWFE